MQIQILRMATRNTKIKYITVKLLGGGGVPRNLIKTTKQPNDKHGKYKAQLTTAVVKPKHISNHKIECGRANIRQHRILCETH